MTNIKYNIGFTAPHFKSPRRGTPRKKDVRTTSICGSGADNISHIDDEKPPANIFDNDHSIRCETATTSHIAYINSHHTGIHGLNAAARYFLILDRDDGRLGANHILRLENVSALTVRVRLVEEVIMRRFVVALVTTAALSFAAQAADMPVKAPIYKAPPAAAFNWSGIYVGGYIGGAFASGNSSANDPFSRAAPFIGPYVNSLPIDYSLDSSVIGGGTIGYNYQIGTWVIGPEAEFGYLHLKGSKAFTAGNGETSANSTVGDWYGAFTARLGYAWDNVLLYGKAGGAVVRQKASVIDSTASAVNPGLLDAEGSRTTWGAALGGGAEWAFAQNWTLKAEYLWLGVNHSVGECALNTGAGSAGFNATFCSNVSFPSVHTVKVGINYLFH